MKQASVLLRLACAALLVLMTAACSAGGGSVAGGVGTFGTAGTSSHTSVPVPSAQPAVAAEAAQAAAPPASAAPAASGAALLDQVHRAIGQAACNSDAQCSSLALGARACGGPDLYLAWSSQATDAVALQRAADRYTQWQSQANQRSGMAGICVMEVDPGAYCKKPAAGLTSAATGRCSLRSVSTGGVLLR